MYVDAAYCYKTSSASVCRLVRLSVTVVNPEKTAEPIATLFRLKIRVSSRNHVLNGGPDRPMRWDNFRQKDMPGHAPQHSAVSCPKMAELIEMPFGLLIRVAQGSMY